MLASLGFLFVASVINSSSLCFFFAAPHKAESCRIRHVFIRNSLKKYGQGLKHGLPVPCWGWQNDASGDLSHGRGKFLTHQAFFVSESMVMSCLVLCPCISIIPYLPTLIQLRARWLPKGNRHHYTGAFNLLRRNALMSQNVRNNELPSYVPMTPKASTSTD